MVRISEFFTKNNSFIIIKDSEETKNFKTLNSKIVDLKRILE